MPLSEHEQRQLEQIEQALYKEDPKFGRLVRSSDPRVHYKRKLVQGLIGVLAGAGSLAAGLVTHRPYLVEAGAAVLALSLVWAVVSWRRHAARVRPVRAARAVQPARSRRQARPCRRADPAGPADGADGRTVAPSPGGRPQDVTERPGSGRPAYAAPTHPGLARGSPLSRAVRYQRGQPVGDPGRAVRHVGQHRDREDPRPPAAAAPGRRRDAPPGQGTVPAQGRRVGRACRVAGPLLGQREPADPRPRRAPAVPS